MIKCATYTQKELFVKDFRVRMPKMNLYYFQEPCDSIFFTMFLLDLSLHELLAHLWPDLELIPGVQLST